MGEAKDVVVVTVREDEDVRVLVVGIDGRSKKAPDIVAAGLRSAHTDVAENDDAATTGRSV